MNFKLFCTFSLKHPNSLLNHRHIFCSYWGSQNRKSKVSLTFLLWKIRCEDIKQRTEGRFSLLCFIDCWFLLLFLLMLGLRVETWFLGLKFVKSSWIVIVFVLFVWVWNSILENLPQVSNYPVVKSGWSSNDKQICLRCSCLVIEVHSYTEVISIELKILSLSSGDYDIVGLKSIWINYG